MLQYEHYTNETAPIDSKALLEKAKKKFGQIPNIQAVMAESPQLLEGYQLLYDLGAKTSFTPIEIQVIYLTISYANDCNYCMAAHSFQALRRDKVPNEIVENLRKNIPLDNPKLEVLRLFVKRALETNGKLESVDYDNFLFAGYHKRNVLEIVLLLAVKIMSNFTNHIANPHLDEIFNVYTWKKDYNLS